MKVSIVYAEQARQQWLHLEVEETTTVAEAINRSGILRHFPAIDLESQKVGIFGKVVKLESPLSEGDRIEIYRPITADPETVERRF